MFRTLVGAVLFGGLLTSAALAAVPAAPDMSKVRCENPQFQHFMVARLPHLISTADNKTQLSQRFSVDGVAQATTVSATPAKIVCEVTFDLSFRGASRPIHGQFSMEFFPGGHRRVKWLPGY